MGRPPSNRVYIRRELDADAALPAGDPNKLTNEQRIKLIELLAKTKVGGAKKGTKPAHTGKIKKPSRNFTQADIERLRGNKVLPEEPPTVAPIDTFLKAIGDATKTSA